MASLNFFIPWRLTTTDERQAGNSKQISSDAYDDDTAIVISAGHLDATLYLPAALRPKKLTRKHHHNATEGDEWCCLIASSTNRPKRVSCHGTCFLPSACTGTMYPHKSIQEQEFYQQVRQITFKNRSYYVRGKVVAETDKSSLELQRQCQEKNGRLLPPYQWCHQWLSSLDASEDICFELSAWRSSVVSLHGMKKLRLATANSKAANSLRRSDCRRLPRHCHAMVSIRVLAWICGV